MKKQIVIFLLFFNCYNTRSQRFVKITNPCSNEFLQTVSGKWIHAADILYAKITKQQQQEIFNRLDKINQLIQDIYPSPIGIDAAWYRSTSDEDFAHQVKVIHFPDGRSKDEFANGIPVVSYYYLNRFCEYSCGRDKYEMRKGFDREESGNLFVYANSFNLWEEGGAFEEMNIEGRRIGMMPIVKGNWKGYTLYTPQTAIGGKSMILLHREGELPYTAVTRKQYLDRSLISIRNMYDKMIADVDKDAKTFIDAGMADPQTLKKNKENLQKQKKDVLKYYEEELAATTAAGLLESPAIIRLAICDVDITHPIFSTEAAGGRLLVTKNPSYIRKDLPKYIPQFFVVTVEEISWSGFTPKPDPVKIVEEKFPIEKLQAMIDK